MLFVFVIWFTSIVIVFTELRIISRPAVHSEQPKRMVYQVRTNSEVAGNGRGIPPLERTPADAGCGR